MAWGAGGKLGAGSRECGVRRFATPSSLLSAVIMCGRFTLRTPARVLIEHFDLDVRDNRQLPLFESRYNIAPTQEILVVRSDPADGQRRADMMRWGLIPSWGSGQNGKSRPPMINA